MSGFRVGEQVPDVHYCIRWPHPSNTTYFQIEYDSRRERDKDFPAVKAEVSMRFGTTAYKHNPPKPGDNRS